LFGCLHPQRGRISLDDRDIHALAPHEIKRLGISYVPQGPNIFPQLTVEEKLLLGGEPSAGLAPRIVEQVYTRLLEVRAQGVTILLVDQNINKAVQVSDYLYMIERGGGRRGGARAEFAGQLRDIVRDSLLGA